MSGFGAFLRKEFREIARTWRIWVLPGMILFFAVTSPILAMIAPKLVTSVMESQPGVVIQIPDPVAADAYRQFMKNQNTVMIAIVIACAGCVSGERKSGAAVLVLTKPLSRAGFVLAKIISQQALITLFTVLGAGLCVLVTAILFGSSPVGPFLLAVVLWLIHASLAVVVMTFLSTLFVSRGAASGVGLGLYFLTRILSMWPLAARFSFAGLAPATSTLLSGERPQMLWPVVTAVLLAGVLAALAIQIFRRTEI